MEHDDGASRLPPITAAFLVVFDQKVGYTIAWKRSLPDLSLDGLEFKTLPSGLHNVKEDLVYFVHGEHVGVSAFLQEEGDTSQRNARFVSVGLLVPLSYGRLGRSWLHAQTLRALAKHVVSDPSKTEPLEEFWDAHKLAEASGKSRMPSSPERIRPSSSSKSKRRRSRALSDSTGDVSGEPSLTADHPALSMLALLDTFGPLFFPLYRAALARKRILIVDTLPVQRTCNYVYDLSILTSIPSSLSEILDPDTEALSRIRPLFSVGVHDIPFLQKNSSSKDSMEMPGWLACTTDDILAEKKQLYDVVVELPGTSSKRPTRWPKLTTSEGKVLKATQRDLRRYATLRKELRRMRRNKRINLYHDDEDEDEDDNQDTSPLLLTSSTQQNVNDDPADMEDFGSLVEPASWTSVAYTSFMWWASAGEKDAWLAEETALDEELLGDLPDMEDAMHAPESPRAERRPSSHTSDQSESVIQDLQDTATVLVAYFHRLTTLIVSNMSEAVEEADDETEEGIEEDAIIITSDDLRRMGLDVGSEADHEFVQEMMSLYFGRQASVAEGGVRLCGMKVC